MKKSTIRITGCYAKLSITRAFTMAEILISLTIIGVIAAITLPSLKANINEKTWATQRKALYSRMSQAISMMPSLNGYGEYSGTWNNDNTVTVEKDNAAERFVADGLAKVLKIKNICTADKLKDCGFRSQISTMSGSKINIPKKISELNNTFFSSGYPFRHIDTKASGFETENGESVVVLYNPRCVDFENSVYKLGEMYRAYIHQSVCANFIYDLNGSRGPNKFGKDIGFMTALYPTDSVIVAPMPLGKDYISKNGNYASSNFRSAASSCRSMNSESRVPNKEEASSMMYNKLLFDMNISNQFVTSSAYVDNLAWYIFYENGYLMTCAKSMHGQLRCIKR